MGDQVIYLEKFVEQSGAMPAELNRILKTIRELDFKYEDLASQVQDEFDLLLSKVPGKTPPEEITALRKKIEEEQALLIQWAEEKVQLALTGHELLDSQMANLADDLGLFREELVEQGIEVDGYVDEYAMDVAPPEPQGRRTGSRMQFATPYDSLDPQVSLEPRGAGVGGGNRKSNQIPLTLSRQQSGYGSEGYGTGSDVIGWDAPKQQRGGGSSRRNNVGGAGAGAGDQGYNSRRRAAAASVHATTAAVAALDDDEYANGGGAVPRSDMEPYQVAAMAELVPGLAHAAREPQAPGRPLTEQDINQNLVGRIAEVYWPDETNPSGSLWYLVKIESVDLQRMTASIRYQNGEMEPDLSLLEVARDEHMMLVNMAG
ncbi:hypothetical protein Ndes2526B_g02913 [Nannochloris sp. 'desiccata']|nr:hypothetical protein KSW81_006834 [Chlorella desiccata (nom. nud.)]KAH7622088.1 putative PHD finger protein ING2 [Chlorella desiccata (nom. nud.)]